jgi:glutamate--cysteine ligase
MNKILKDKSDIVDYFNNGCKKEKHLKIGVEHEKFFFENKSNNRINFYTVLKIFDYLTKFGWKSIKEGLDIVSLSRGDQKITLEPGNQIELSGARLDNIHLTCDESYKFLEELKEVCNHLNLKMMSISFDPSSKLQDVSQTPKKRYKIMTEEMPKKGKLSLEMMYQTTGTQINLDYISESDFSKKFKLISHLVPLSIAIFANSPFKESKANGYLSYRSRVWQETARGGLPKSYLEEMNFEKYTDMVINTPLLFIVKNNRHLSVNNKTFKDFMDGKINNLKPTYDDLKNHLSTIFTEVRLKQYLEIRSLDTCEWNCHCAGPAFYVGLLYGRVDASLEIIKNWKIDEVLNAYREVPKKGLNTLINGKSLLEWGKMFLKLSEEGLRQRSFENKKGLDETIFLNNIRKILLDNKTKAELALEKFKSYKSIDFLYEEN